MRHPAGLPLLLLVAALALGWNLNGYRLLDPDEGRNAEVAREMAQANDYLIPHLDGLPYLDKPIVYFAASAFLMEFLGPTETAARLPAYFATLATIALLVWFARRRWGAAAGWLAGIAFATMPLTLAYAHTTIFDSILTLCTTAAIVSFFLDRPILAWIAMGVGALTKGPVALAVPLIVMSAYRLATGAALRRLVSLRALAAFAVVTLPWFLAVARKLPEFPHYAFVVETLRRYATPSFHRTAPFWYYLPIIPVAAFPWFVPACARLGRWRATWAARRDIQAREPVWLAAWVLAPLALFTLNHSKLPQYVLPLMPAFALAAARTLATEGPRTAWRTYVGVAALLGGAFITLPHRIVAPLPLTPAEQAAIPRTALVLGSALLASAACLAVAARRQQTSLGAFGYAIVVISLPFASAGLLEAVGDDRSAGRLAGAIRPVLERADASGNHVEVLGVAAYPPSLPFYLARTISVATASAQELTSTYIATYQDRYRGLPNSPLKPPDFWKTVLASCPTPTVFVISSDNREGRAALASLPLRLDDGHYVAYGPCGAPGQGVR